MHRRLVHGKDRNDQIDSARKAYADQRIGTDANCEELPHWRQHADFGSMIAFATVLGNASTAMIAFATVLGNASTELVKSSIQQMEIKRMQLLIGIAVAMLAGVLYIGWNLSVFSRPVAIHREFITAAAR